jgi:adenylate cyclase
MKSFSATTTAALFALVITFVVGLVLCLPFGRQLEAWMSDHLQLWRYELAKVTTTADKPDSHLILASIDQRSVNDLGSWPFPRGVHGQFLQVLAPAQPKVVGWDVFFTEEMAASPTAQNPPAVPPSSAPGTDSQLQPDDQALVDGAKLFPRLITGATPPSGPTLNDDVIGPTQPLKRVQGDISHLIFYRHADLPFPELRKVSYFGFVAAPADDLRRTMPLVVNFNGQVFPSLSLQILLQYWSVDPDQVTVDIGHEIVIPRPGGGEARIPIDGSGRLLVNYRARERDFRWISYSLLGKGLADVANNQQSEERKILPALKDNIVVVGVTLSGTDNGPIPIDTYSPLVVANLNVLNNLLQEDYLHAASPVVWMPIYALFLFAVGNLMLRVGIAPMIPIGFAALLVMAGTAFAALWFANELVPVLLPEVGILVLGGAVPTRRFFGEEREKMRIKGAMRAYLSDKVMAKVLEHPDNLKLGGIKEVITIMFCDIRGFTAYCDERDPQETMDVLNEYMETMTQVVFKHDGTIDKYIGDCIMAFWNQPELQPDHPQRAVQCAMEMRAALAEFTAKRVGTELANFECGIGIHTGEALVGNMGSSLKRNYTAMGSTVNLASRLESLTKKLGERILISVDTRDLLQGEFPLVDRGEQTVAGVGRPVHVYGVVSQAEYAARLAEGVTTR